MQAHAEELLASCSGTEQNSRKARPTQMKGIHVLMAFAVSQGRSRMELAEDMGYPFEEVRKITESESFQEAVTKFIHEQGEDLVQKRLDASLLDSVQCLVSLRDSPATKDAVRLEACKYLINRVQGTPSQHIITERKVAVDPLTEMESIEQQLSQFQEVTKKHVRGSELASLQEGSVEKP